MNRRFPLSILTILLLGLVLVTLDGVPFAHALPAFDTQTNGEFTNSAGPTPTHNPVSLANAGELIVVTISTEDSSVAVCGSERTVSAITDSTGSVVFTELSGSPVCSTTGGHVGISDIWYGLSFSTVAQTISLTMSGAVAFVWYSASFYTLLGDNVLASATGTCQNGASCAAIATTSSSASYNSGDVVVGVATSSSGDMSSKGSGFTASTYFNGVADVASCAADAIANFCFQYILPVSSSSTNYPANLQVSNRDWADIGVVFGPALVTTTVTSTITRVVACNFFQEQCWWIPTLYLGMYVGLWVGIAASVTTRPRSLTYVFLASTSFATLYTVLLGILPYPFAIMAFVAAIAYALRLDGVF